MTVPERDKAAPTAETPSADTPLRLSVAAELAFPGGGMTASGLRREAARGRLEIERIAGKDFTTLHAIEKMRERCRVTPKIVPVSISTVTRPRPQPGSSVMDEADIALAAARLSIESLRHLPPKTVAPWPKSPANTGPRGRKRPPK